MWSFETFLLLARLTVEVVGAALNDVEKTLLRELEDFCGISLDARWSHNVREGDVRPRFRDTSKVLFDFVGVEALRTDFVKMLFA